MTSSAVRAISKRFEPPAITVRDGRILDDYGSEDCAQLQIAHRATDQVKDADLQYYHDAFPFLGPRDLIFYLSPVLSCAVASSNPGFLDSFLYCLDTNWSLVEPELTTEEGIAVRDAISDLAQSHPGLIQLKGYSNFTSAT